MFHHIELTKKELSLLIRKGEIKLGGNKRLKIYGTLSCTTGKRMKKENRVFFQSGDEGIHEGYRACGHCMKTEFGKWKERDELNPSRSSDNSPPHHGSMKN
jgi:hypothetical protein